MNTERRAEIAAATRSVLPRLQRAVTASWPDLLPASDGWRQASMRRARAASRAALEGLATALEQGDLDDQSWERIRHVVHGQGHASSDEAGELLRTVRVVGVDALADELAGLVGLAEQERFALQREAAVYCERLLGDAEEMDQRAYDEMLAVLEREGPDLA